MLRHFPHHTIFHELLQWVGKRPWETHPVIPRSFTRDDNDDDDDDDDDDKAQTPLRIESDQFILREIP